MPSVNWQQRHECCFHVPAAGGVIEETTCRRWNEEIIFVFVLCFVLERERAGDFRIGLRVKLRSKNMHLYLDLSAFDAKADPGLV